MKHKHIEKAYTPWRVQLSEAIAKSDATVEERTELLEWLAQETPDRAKGQTAADVVFVMLRTQRRATEAAK